MSNFYNALAKRAKLLVEEK